MATYLRPGVYVQETLNPIAPVVGPSSNSVAAFLGANDRGPTTPTLVTSWSQYITLFGSWNTNASNALPLALYMFFANGGNQAYVTRVVGSSSASATRSVNDRAESPVATLKVSANSAGTWGNALNFSITNSVVGEHFDLTIFSGGTASSNIVEQWTQLSMTSTDPRYAINVVNSNSNYVTLTDLASTTARPNNNPALTANQTLTSGANGGSVTGATIVAVLSELDVVTNSLVINMPGISDATSVNAAIAYAEDRGDVFVIVDGINDTVTNQLNLSESYTAAPVAAVYYPQITIADPTLGVGGPTNATLKVGAGAAVAGLFATTDASRGVFKAPAGLQARIVGAVSVDKLTSTQLDALNSDVAPVNAIRYIPGSGIVVMGARTLAAGYIDKYVPVRRTLIYLEKALKELTQFAVFEPNDVRLWSRINSAVSSFLTSFWSQGGLSGASPAQAYFVKCDADINPQSAIDNGIVNIQIGIALQRPAEFVVLNIGQYSGGTTVTVA